MKQKSPVTKSTKPVINRRARFDFELGQEIIAGLMLTGPEVRGARSGHIRLTGSFASLRGGELWLNNMSITIPKTAQAAVDAKEIASPRKLLVSTKQLAELEKSKQNGLTIVPTKVLTNGRFIKVVLSVAKGKKRYDKRQVIKQRQQDRDSQRALKG